MTEFKGVIPPVVTAFDSDRNLDLDRTAEFIRWQIDKGVHGIFVAGSTGEYTLLSDSELKDLIKAGVEAVDGDVPCLAGAGFHSTKKTIELSQYAEEVGADGVTVAVPHYPKPTQEGLYQHYRMISENVSIPVLVYAWPGQHAGLNLEPETVARLADQGIIAGMKDATTDIVHTTELIRLTKGKIAILEGFASQLLQLLIVGAAGAICTVANVIPEEVASIYDNFQKGNLEEAKEMQLKILPIIKATAADPYGTKEALNLIGESVGPSPFPIIDVPDAVRSNIEKELRELGKLS